MNLFGKKKSETNSEDTTITNRVRKALLGDEMSDFITYIKSPWRIVWANFLGGIFRGLGIIIGMTVVIALIIWTLSQMVNFPLIGQFFQDLLDLLQQFSPQNGYR
jgi:hypothetical protein